MPIKYIPYFPNTVEGQALLDSFTRTRRALSYRDNDKVISKILRGMPYYEVEEQEQVGESSDNMVIRGECISACAYLNDKGIKVDLVYIDPPFASGADYAKQVYIRKNPLLAENISNVEEQLETDELKSFEEIMYGDIWKKEDYLNWMYENLMAIKSVMSETASIYVHLDWHIGHYVKIIMDEIFGEDNFRNEIIWYYADYMQGNATTGYARKHDNIYFYTKNEKYIFNRISEKLEEPVERNKVVWDKETKTLKVARDNNGKIIYEQFDSKIIDSVWSIGQTSVTRKTSSENVFYDTQKPKKLLHRLIELRRMVEASTKRHNDDNKSMVVADFFGGSGVTALVAHETHRNFIHVDIGINSIQTTRDRLVEADANFNILEIKDGVNLFRNPKQTMEKLARLIPGLQQQVPGIGKFWFGALQDSKSGTVPVYVPNLVDSTERVLDIPLVNQIINEEIQNLDINTQKAIVYYIDVDDRKAIETFIKDHNPTTTKIELRDLKEILYAVVVDDEVKIQTNKISDGYEIIIEKFYSDRLKQKLAAFNEKRALQAMTKGSSFTPLTISEEGLELIEHISLDCENKDGPWRSSTEIKIDKNGYVSLDGNKTKTFWDGRIKSKDKPSRIKIRNISGDEIIKSIL